MNEQLSSDLASLRISREVDPDAKPLWRTIIIVLLVVLALVGITWALLVSLKTGLVAKAVATTQVRLVSPAQSSVQVTSTGYVVAQVTSKVSAKVLGRVAGVSVRQGDVVKQGDVLMTLDTTEQRASLAVAHARYAAAVARAATARASLAESELLHMRQKALLERGATARSVVEDLEAHVSSLKESLKAAEADAQAEKAATVASGATLSESTITAPISGTVLGTPAEVGALVGPTSGPVVELADFTSLMVETDVPEGRLHMVKVGSPAEIVLDAYPAVRHRGELAEVSPRVNRAKATVIVKVKFLDEITGVLPDMAARVSVLNEALDAEAMKKPPFLVVPSNAIVERNGQKVVFRVDEGRARQTPIRLGAATGDGYELADGPREGTRLVANPPPELIDGDSIKEKNP